ncbi:MAG: nucleoside triphosphate pyrophosphohydrolase [Actinomycetota bacterium]|nr:nucleoside triphosphate pyrophosphohydrolase [Actinomycetota bacterium]
MTTDILVVGLGPAGLDRLPPATRAALDDPEATVVVRTLEHPAAAELAGTRGVTSGDDLYDTAAGFDAVYGAIAARVVAAASLGPVIYAVPGSATVGERSVPLVLAEATAAGLSVEVWAGESFLDLVWLATGCDPIAGGAQVLDGRALPDPLQLHLPTVVTQVDRSEVLADVVAVLGRVLPDDTPIMVLDRLGEPDQVIVTVDLHHATRYPVGPRTSLYLDPPANGWYGLVSTNRRLRAECPWDREQTHHTLVTHLIEEAYETVEALAALPSTAPVAVEDPVPYAAVEEELGDLLLQTVFHATLAEEAGMFGVEEVAEGIRRKLVRRHPHVFGDAAADDAATVLARWEKLKTAEKQRQSLLDGIPQAMPALSRAEKLQRRASTVGFDWSDPAEVLAKVAEELGELEAAVDDPPRRGDELGDLLFSVVNLARHLAVDPELAFRRANDRFEVRFRRLEELAAAAGDQLEALSLAQLDALWDQAKLDLAQGVPTEEL